MHPFRICDNLRSLTSEVILFHSGTGKDSIVLLDLLSKKFDRVQCVFEYIVKGLEYENNYIAWAEKKYPNCKFIQVPHYALSSFVKHGYLGVKKDASQPLNSIQKIDAKIKTITGIEWSVYGFKKIDGITRRVMLNGYPDGLFHKTKKAYPLKDLKNADCLKYISDNNLIQPFNYGTTKPSSGCDISTPEFLAYMRTKYPADLHKIFEQFPECEVTLFKHDNYPKAKAIRNRNDKAVAD